MVHQTLVEYEQYLRRWYGAESLEASIELLNVSAFNQRFKSAPVNQRMDMLQWKCAAIAMNTFIAIIDDMMGPQFFSPEMGMRGIFDEGRYFYQIFVSKCSNVLQLGKFPNISVNCFRGHCPLLILISTNPWKMVAWNCANWLSWLWIIWAWSDDVEILTYMEAMECEKCAIKFWSYGHCDLEDGCMQ